MTNSSGTDASVSTGSGYSDGEIYETTATTGSGIGLKVQVSVSGAEQQINGVQSILYGGYGYAVNDVVQVVGGANDGYLKIGSGVTTGIGTTALATPLLEIKDETRDWLYILPELLIAILPIHFASERSS